MFFFWQRLKGCWNLSSITLSSISEVFFLEKTAKDTTLLRFVLYKVMFKQNCLKFTEQILPPEVFEHYFYEEPNFKISIKCNELAQLISATCADANRALLVYPWRITCNLCWFDRLKIKIRSFVSSARRQVSNSHHLTFRHKQFFYNTWIQFLHRWEFDFIILNFYQTDLDAKFISYICSKSSKQKHNNDNICKIGSCLLNLWMDGVMHGNVQKKWTQSQLA